jgi:DNA-binding CsgD family transcriptional regulator
MPSGSNLHALNAARRRPLAERFWSRVHKNRGCWIWSGSRNRRGYGTINYDGNRPALTHRVAWELTNGPIPEGMHVLHRCDNPACVRIDHLFLGTDLDNVRDMDRKGRRVNANQRLSPEQVDEIRQMLGVASQRSIAEKFGVDQSTISRLVTRLRRA